MTLCERRTGGVLYVTPGWGASQRVDGWDGREGGTDKLWPGDEGMDGFHFMPFQMSCWPRELTVFPLCFLNSSGDFFVIHHLRYVLPLAYWLFPPRPTTTSPRPFLSLDEDCEDVPADLPATVSIIIHGGAQSHFLVTFTQSQPALPLF